MTRVNKYFCGFTELKKTSMSNNENEMNELVLHDKDWIAHYGKQQNINFDDNEQSIEERLTTELCIIEHYPSIL